ncbi:hypothetical protein CDD82_4623 [Ophiocordyceps australis]|uniref:FZ domain-containing protein n=1 Tax=Ophiocordyceps australis TaxID=1399860 RepID=A0A2C5YZM8_9HYPO|nr:hypothetical protein CDD82_4623 [Ophiocordyceps australis]
MQPSQLQSRMAASVMTMMSLWLLFSWRAVALDPQGLLNSQDALTASESLGDEGFGDMPGDVSYEADFGLFDRSIVGRAPQSLVVLSNNEPKALNLQAGDTTCYKVEKKVIFGDNAGNGPRNKTIYVSANTCQQPIYTGQAKGRAPPAPQLMLRVSNSNEAACQSSVKDGINFREGAVTLSYNATDDTYIGIIAPNVTSEFQGVYNFEVAVSLDDFFHRYESRGGAELLWMDSDSTSALLVTRNLTEDADDVSRIMAQQPPYELFVSNSESTATDGLRHSVCGLQNTAQIFASSAGSGAINSPYKTGLTLRGPGRLPKQQFLLVALNASSSYSGTLVKKANATNVQKRQQDERGGPGSILFQATDFQTVSGTNCKVVTDLEFCNEIQYAVPGNDQKFNNTALAKAYDDYAKSMYENFEKVMMQIQCEAGKTSLYSLARNCDDCRTAYKNWLCTVSIPRCENFGSSNPFAVKRNAAQAFPNGTMLDEEERNKLEPFVSSQTSRNKFIDSEIQPGPYKEILPCEELCYEVVQSCPAAIQFNCPQSGTPGFEASYHGRERNGSTVVACNYPGEARTPMSAAQRIVPDAMLLVSGLGVAAAWALR